jgi:hypothetical protein
MLYVIAKKERVNPLTGRYDVRIYHVTSGMDLAEQIQDKLCKSGFSVSISSEEPNITALDLLVSEYDEQLKPIVI